MFNKRLGVLFAAGMAALSLIGCGSDGTDSQIGQAPLESAQTKEETEAGEVQDEAASEAEQETSGSSETGTSSDISEITVGLVTDAGGIEDQSFNQSAWEGLQWLAGRSGCSVRFLESDSDNPVASNLEELAAQGVNLCWAIGYDSANAILEAAAQHPEINYAIIDNYYEETPVNVTGVVFRDQEPSFMAGYIAANMTETGKVGFVGGEKNEVIEQFQYGFMAGVAYGATEKGKTVAVEPLFADSFTDLDKGKEIGDRLYENGCDIIYQAAGQTGVGVIDAAKEAGKYVIGVDKDQAYLAPENVLTSVMKYVNEAVVKVSEEYLDGENIGGMTQSLGLAEESMGISENHSLYPDELYEKTLELGDKISSGELQVPATESEYEQYVAALQ